MSFQINISQRLAQFVREYKPLAYALLHISGLQKTKGAVLIMLGSENTKFRQDPIDNFLADMEPFFLGQLVSYADLGAKSGKTFEAAQASKLSLNRVLLAEANPKIFRHLEKAVATYPDLENLRCLNVAVSDKVGFVRVKYMNNMITFLPHYHGAVDKNAAEKSDDGYFDVEATTLDNLLDFFPQKHASILKIDVEGHELSVLGGAKNALSEKRVDVVYVEAAMQPGIAGQTYIREIEDALGKYGYSLFKVYEQTHDRVTDRPVLRRVNLAFFSKDMVDRYPMPLMNKLAQLRRDLTETKQAKEEQKRHYEKVLQDRFSEIAQLTRQISRPNQGTALPQAPTYRVPKRINSRNASTSRKSGNKLGLKPKYINALLAVLLYLLGVLTPILF